MFKREYHCLIAGLPDLFFDDGKYNPDLAGFREELKKELHPDDEALVSLLFLPVDHRNLLKFVEDKESIPEPLGNFSREDFEEQSVRLDSILEEENILPDYMAKVMEDFYRSEEKPDPVVLEIMLTQEYYRLVLESKNAFLSQWLTLERDANNIVTAFNLRKHEAKPGRQLIDENPLAEELDIALAKDRDFSAPPEPEYAQELFTIAGIDDFLEREKKIDHWKWTLIDEMSFFHYFTIEKILAYMIKLIMVARWRSLDPDTGKQLFRRLIEEMKQPLSMKTQA